MKSGRITGWLTLRSNGLFLLTNGKPVFAEIGNTGKQDAYPKPGDEIGYNNLCQWSVKAIWGIEPGSIGLLQSVRVEVNGRVIE